ncbi:hypothetical protein EVAR_18729_1 [Eumeta japonica]|uniref:Uncharacterized protein n=1 Tax=Eumeta variegata TaxID=151549 RepID=A0A4C1UNH0_EUMVA|nr:hypothetical protein EVAR_18729_1 [Eumeta japonica]
MTGTDRIRKEEVSGTILRAKMTSELRIKTDDFLLSQRESFDDYEMKANEKTGVEYNNGNQRVRRRKRHHNDESAEEVALEKKTS